MEHTLCLGYTSYRQETLPLAARTMAEYPVVVLEEPKTPGFEAMLAGDLDLDTYLELSDFEFPEYSRQSCRLMQDLAAQGIHVLQMDPFMEELIGIHEFFALNGRPQDIPPQTPAAEVYEQERRWTACLLEFYKRSQGKDFGRLVASVQDFAREDAGRGRLRGSMRAKALADVAYTYPAMYVEAGYIHIYLARALGRVLPGSWSIRHLHLLEPVLRPRIGRRQLLAPGDVLTFVYTFHPEHRSPRADLLAAQSMVYNKVVAKEQLPTSPSEPFPHLDDEIQAISLASALDYEQCRQVYARVKSLSVPEAREYIRSWQRSRRH